LTVHHEPERYLPDYKLGQIHQDVILKKLITKSEPAFPCSLLFLGFQGMKYSFQLSLGESLPSVARFHFTGIIKSTNISFCSLD